MGGAALFDLVFGTLFNGLSALFWLAFLWRARRLSFFAPGGAFLLQSTEWAAAPLRRHLPRGRFDWANLLLAWVAQMVLLFLKFLILGHLPSLPVAGVIGVVLIGGAVETLYLLGYLIFWLVLAAVLMSWLRPDAPMAPVIQALTDPWLDPIRRWVPPLAGVDLSPIILFLGLQLLAILGGELRFALVRGLLASSIG